jgi:hypothetical protein
VPTQVLEQPNARCKVESSSTIGSKKDYILLCRTLSNETLMKENLKRFLNPGNIIAFFLWACLMALVIYWNNSHLG